MGFAGADRLSLQKLLDEVHRGSIWCPRLQFDFTAVSVATVFRRCQTWNKSGSSFMNSKAVHVFHSREAWILGRFTSWRSTHWNAHRREIWKDAKLVYVNRWDLSVRATKWCDISQFQQSFSIFQKWPPFPTFSFENDHLWPCESPCFKVIGSLIDLDCSEDFIKTLLQNVSSRDRAVALFGGHSHI